jgi:hypothetical protein
VISVEPIDYFSFECDLFPSRENIIRSRTVLGTPRLRANAFTFNISLGELAHPDRGWNVLRNTREQNPLAVNRNVSPSWAYANNDTNEHGINVHTWIMQNKKKRLT